MKYFFLTLIFILSFKSQASVPMTYFYHPPESPLDVRYNYHWSILKSALDVTQKKYGEYEMKASVFMTEDRQVRELLKRESKLNTMIRETSVEFEKKFLPVRIPIDRNLIGYRVLLINKKDRELFKNVNTLEDLKKLSFGQGAGWGDVEILKAAGLNVVTEVYYDKIFENLRSGQFTAFPRSVTEVQEEFDKRKDKMPELMIEESILLYYPLPTYFWFPATEEGKRLRARVKEGMEMIIANGEFDKLFDQHYRAKITNLKIRKRKFFRIDNPMLPSSVTQQKKQFWVDLNNF